MSTGFWNILVHFLGSILQNQCVCECMRLTIEAKLVQAMTELIMRNCPGFNFG